ncbi:Transposon Ty3-I Gag-Pol polyprotein [Gossypium australe]|uniref:Transposon Ty3-I Gag-Pol polyprotein n=1 Tax=Gossypium australe TaxID=47621 RepID=A0A5B6UYW7_9ROSI|nr:Transposon Ty3-I Gag-Pol polyprotein [Gossypium australe]
MKDAFSRFTAPLGFSGKYQVKQSNLVPQAYAIRARKEASALDVITGTFSLFEVTIYALIDSGSTYSYICTALVTGKKILVESTDYVVKVTNPIGQCVRVDKICKNFPLRILGCDFLFDLMLLPFNDFDVILGMWWLTLHDAVVNCRRKTVIWLMLKLIELTVSPTLFLLYQFRNLSEKDVKQELLGLPPIRDVEFAIELVPRNSPISISLYRMAPTKLKEGKAQLQELIEQ